MPTDQSPLPPDEEREEPRVRDDFDADQGPPVEDEDAPAAGVVDAERPEPPEPGEPG
jgi:hypothetical protein